MKDLGDLHYFLGVHVNRTSNTLLLSQHKYLYYLLHKFDFANTKLVPNPMASHTILSHLDGDLLADPTIYKGMVGALQYLTMTHPNIAYAVNIVSQFIHASCTTNLIVIKFIFNYLKGTPQHGFLLRKAK